HPARGCVAELSRVFSLWQATAMSVDCLGQHAVLSGLPFLAAWGADCGLTVGSGGGAQDEGGAQHCSGASLRLIASLSWQSNQRVDLYKWRDGAGEVGRWLQGHTRVDLYKWRDGAGEVGTELQGHTRVISGPSGAARGPRVSTAPWLGELSLPWPAPDLEPAPPWLPQAPGGLSRVWLQKPGTAVEYLAAHLSKIHGLDWHPDNEYVLATSSQDNSVRFWDYRQPRKYLNILPCQVPVWKARAGSGGRRLAYAWLASRTRAVSASVLATSIAICPLRAQPRSDPLPSSTAWFSLLPGSKDSQLVTWSAREVLRSRPLGASPFQLCATDLLDGVEELMHGLALLPEPEKTLHGQDSEPPPNAGPGDEEGEPGSVSLSRQLRRETSRATGLPQTLQQEFSLINVQIRNVNVEMDAVNRSCTVSVHCGSQRVKLRGTFPVQYPNNGARGPGGCGVGPPGGQGDLGARLFQNQEDSTSSNPYVLPSAVTPPLPTFANQEDSTSSNPYVLPSAVTPPLPTFARVSNAYGSYQDSNIPFPRTPGARFCGAGYLVYFTRPMTMHRAVSPTEPTPRSLSALSAYHSGLITPMKMRTETTANGSLPRSEKEQVSISSFYYKERRKSSQWSSGRQTSAVPDPPTRAGWARKVIIQDVSCLLPVHKALGEQYITDVKEVQRKVTGADVALRNPWRRDLVQVWSLATVATDLCLGPKSDPDLETPWAQHPFGRQLLESLLHHAASPLPSPLPPRRLAHYCQLHDVQTLAMLCSVFEAQSRPQGCVSPAGPFPPRSSTGLSHSRYPSFASSGSCSSMSDPGLNAGGWNIGKGGDTELQAGTSTPAGKRFSSGLGRSSDRAGSTVVLRHPGGRGLLDPANTQQFDDFKKCYGEILYRWGLREKRAEVLKFVSCPPDPHKGIEFGVYCSHCRSEVRGTQCAICKGFTFQCAICHVAVRGSSNFCLTCGHGGHTSHMMEWFRTQEVCATG
uniref:WD repeat domain 59 n=1 Tax=Pelodiscus sinensis TaxID=13735 RepID=K7G0Q8_PELSI